MRLSKEIRVRASEQTVAGILAEDSTLTGLFPESETKIVAREGSRRTVRSHYRALGREGDATFHFDVDERGGMHFEKVCDGNVWKQLRGGVRFEGRGGRTWVRISLEGKTKGLVPEFTIKVPMQQQIDQMAEALVRLCEQGDEGD